MVFKQQICFDYAGQEATHPRFILVRSFQLENVSGERGYAKSDLIRPKLKR